MYQPTEIDLIWFAQTLEIMNEGGLLVFPSSGLIYKVSHDHKTLTLQNPAKLQETICRELHAMTETVAAFFGYVTKEATQ